MLIMDGMLVDKELNTVKSFYSLKSIEGLQK
jgi:hypothetical protein